MKRFTRAIVATSVALSFALAGCAPSEEATTSFPVDAPASTMAESVATATPKPTETEEPEPNGTMANPYPFGQLVRPTADANWLTTIESITFDVALAWPQTTIPEGNTVVGGTMTAIVHDEADADRFGEPVSASASLLPIFIGSDGRIYGEFRDTGNGSLIENEWRVQSDIIANPGVTVTGEFALSVPEDVVSGGQFAVQHLVSGEIVYFGPVVE